MRKSFLVLMVLALASTLPAFGRSNLAGTYRCASFNVGGAGGSCRNVPALVLQGDGTYQMSSERGHYSVQGGLIHLDQSKLRGDGRIQGDQIIFQYQYRGLPQVMTYQRQGGAYAVAASPAGALQAQSVAHAQSLVTVDLTLIFRQRDGWISWVNSAKLVPRGGNSQYQELARTDGKQTVKVSFLKGVQTGFVYDLQLGSGKADYEVTQIDLRYVAGPVQKTIYLDVPTTKPVNQPTPQPTPKPGPAPQPTPVIRGGVPCDPNQPHYTQPSCVEDGTGPLPTPQPQPSPVTGKLCNPNLPHYQQPTCLELR